MIGLLTGVTRMILVYVYNDSSGDCLTPDTRPAILKNFHYMYFALLITLMTAVSAIVISYFTGRPTEEQVHLTMQPISQKQITLYTCSLNLNTVEKTKRLDCVSRRITSETVM